VGEAVGEDVGESVGEAVGEDVGESVGVAVGEDVGDAVGDAVGDPTNPWEPPEVDVVGEVLGGAVGLLVGERDGLLVGGAYQKETTLARHTNIHLLSSTKRTHPSWRRWPRPTPKNASSDNHTILASIYDSVAFHKKESQIIFVR